MNGDVLERKKEFGDYQTPFQFSKEVCEYLKNELHVNPSIVIEPTCGLGSFIKASYGVFNTAEQFYGIEVNKEYCEFCKKDSPAENITIINENFFTYDLKKISKQKEDVLIIGNPPWVTNSDLEYNLPEKINFKGLLGIDAITGASNFDICEYIILQLIEEFKNTNAIISMLCKTSVARNIFQELNRNKIKVKNIKMLEFNSKKIFSVNTSACILIVELSEKEENYNICEIYDFSRYKELKRKIGYIDGKFYSNMNSELNFEGVSCFEWRQGVKHDASKVMELKDNRDGTYTNGNKQIVDIEDDFVFQLVKSSHFKTPIIRNYKKKVIVTQRKPKEQTKYIEDIAPKTWKYLNENIEVFRNRKSSIYNGAPDFCMFGIGDYSYAEYKVGVSGFYKKPLFCLLHDEKPVMCDDTSYFISFDDKENSYTCMLLLNSDKVQNFLFNISFKDAKRPYTKKVLMRIDFKKCYEHVSFKEIEETERKLNLEPFVTKEMYNKFGKLINKMY